MYVSIWLSHFAVYLKKYKSTALQWKKYIFITVILNYLPTNSSIWIVSVFPLNSFFFFLNEFVYFNWRLITLKHCGGFCRTFDMNQPWVDICCRFWTLFPPPSPPHLSGSSQCTSPEHPVSCIEPGLVIYFQYVKIHVSMLFSQITPPSPSSRVQKLFFISVSLLLSCI